MSNICIYGLKSNTTLLRKHAELCKLFPKWDKNPIVQAYVSRVKDRNTKTTDCYERWYSKTLFELQRDVPMEINSFVFVYCFRNQAIDTLSQWHEDSLRYPNSYWFLRIYWGSFPTTPLLRLCARAIGKNKSLYDLEELPDELKTLIDDF
jgi:hypothetical protein